MIYNYSNIIFEVFKAQAKVNDLGLCIYTDNMNTTEQFKKIKQNAEDFYQEIDNVYCPYLRAKVNFNAKGLDHKSRNFERIKNIGK